VDPDDYTVIEQNPIETNWIHTTATTLVVTVGAGEDKTVTYGNVCTGAGGGLTPGFWSNKNGQALFGSDDLALMVSLNLRDGAGGALLVHLHGGRRERLRRTEAEGPRRAGRRGPSARPGSNRRRERGGV